ncbi:MAG: hypothetical protein GY754_31470 [bacterium]|nr:hypothetical protein [bacterium]
MVAVQRDQFLKKEYTHLHEYHTQNEISYFIDAGYNRKGIIVIPINLFGLKVRNILNTYFPNNIEYIRYYKSVNSVAFGFNATEYSDEMIYNILHNACIQTNLVIAAG